MESTKNILNQPKERKEQPNQINKPKSNLQSDEIGITQDSNNLYIQVNKKWANEQGSYELIKSLTTALSPLFLNQNRTPQKEESISESVKGFKHIAFFMEQMPHYTGGRYSILHQALLLSQLTKVTFFTNQKPPFYDDFKDYFNDNFQLNVDPNFGLHSTDTDIDLVVGAPVTGGQYAKSYAEKFDLPYYLILFESPNWVSTMRDGVDASEDFWKGYKKALLACDKVIVPSYESKKWASEWLGRDDIDVIYPCINQIVADEVKKSKEKKQLNSNKTNVFFSARQAPFKNPFALIKKMNKNKYSFHVIGKTWDSSNQMIDKLKEEGYDLNVYGTVDDKKKFEILKDCDIMIFPTEFEGFGMPPMEALYFGKPVVAYDLPVLREIYGSSIEYVPVGDLDKFVNKIEETISRQPEARIPSFSYIRSCLGDLMDSLGIPKISSGTIVYNGSDYIEYSIKSIYHLLWEIIIVDGSVKGYNKNKTPYSTDGTKKIIDKLKKGDYLDKITYIKAKSKYESKIQQQNEIAKRVTGKYYLKLDHDEVWKSETLLEAIGMMENNPQITILKMPFLHFWLSFNKVARDAGGKWTTKHPRIWRWDSKFKHINSFNYFEKPNKERVIHPFYKEINFASEYIYHFGWVRTKDKLLEKINYYKNRKIESHVEDTVSNWKENNDKTQPTQDVESWAEDFNGELPKVLKKHPYYNIKDIRDHVKKSIKSTTN